jgi:hypothetical protein
MRSITAEIALKCPTLAPGELPPRGLIDISPAQRAALIACAIAGNLSASRRGWYAAGHPNPINHLTVGVLRRRLLLTGRSRRSARLTDLGKWYARGVASAIAGACLSTD